MVHYHAFKSTFRPRRMLIFLGDGRKVLMERRINVRWNSPVPGKSREFPPRQGLLAQPYTAGWVIPLSKNRTCSDSTRWDVWILLYFLLTFWKVHPAWLLEKLQGSFLYLWIILKKICKDLDFVCKLINDHSFHFGSRKKFSLHYHEEFQIQTSQPFSLWAHILELRSCPCGSAQAPCRLLCKGQWLRSFTRQCAPPSLILLSLLFFFLPPRSSYFSLTGLQTEGLTLIRTSPTE